MALQKCAIRQQVMEIIHIYVKEEIWRSHHFSQSFQTSIFLCSGTLSVQISIELPIRYRHHWTVDCQVTRHQGRGDRYQEIYHGSRSGHGIPVFQMNIPVKDLWHFLLCFYYNQLWPEMSGIEFVVQLD